MTMLLTLEQNPSFSFIRFCHSCLSRGLEHLGLVCKGKKNKFSNFNFECGIAVHTSETAILKWFLKIPKMSWSIATTTIYVVVKSIGKGHI